MGISKGVVNELELREEIQLTKIIGNIIMESAFRCIAYNICKDHLHMVLVTSKEQLTTQVQKIKSVSSKLIKPYLSAKEKPLDLKTNYKKGKAYTPFWSQKFYRANLDVWSLGSLSSLPGHIYSDTHLSNTIYYIVNNRKKHQLEKSEELESIIDDFLIDVDTAFDLR